MSKQGEALHHLLYLENGYVAAGTFEILFENGFDIYADDGEEMLFDSIDIDIIFGRIEQFNRRRYDVWFHTWLVFVGYGAEPKNGTSPVDIVYENGENEEFGIKEFEISDLKNHRNFDFAIYFYLYIYRKLFFKNQSPELYASGIESHIISYVVTMNRQALRATQPASAAMKSPVPAFCFMRR